MTGRYKWLRSKAIPADAGQARLATMLNAVSHRSAAFDMVANTEP